MALMCLAMASAPAHAEDPVPIEQVGARNLALTLIVRADSFKAIEYLSTIPDPETAMSVFSLVTRDLYWERKDLTAAMALGRAGVEFGLNTSLRYARDNPDLAYRLRSQAKSIAYDLASFSWPGWEEPGIEIDTSDLVLGQDAAKTNLRLAVTLKKGDLPMSRAYWILGVHHLAADKPEGARKAFVEGIKYATAAEARDFELLLRGYVYLIDIISDPLNSSIRTELEFVLSELDRSRDGRFYGEQLQRSLRIYGGPAP